MGNRILGVLMLPVLASVSLAGLSEEVDDVRGAITARCDVLGAAVDPSNVPYASPAVRRYARELGADLGRVEHDHVIGLRDVRGQRKAQRAGVDITDVVQVIVVFEVAHGMDACAFVSEEHIADAEYECTRHRLLQCSLSGIFLPLGP